MKIKKRMHRFAVMIALLAAGCASGNVMLKGTDATLVGKDIKIEKKNGSQHIGYWKSGDSAEWSFSVSENGSYFFDFLYASPEKMGANCFLYIDGVKVSESSFEGTGTGWWTFADRTMGPLNLSAGNHTLKIVLEKDAPFCGNIRHILIRKSDGSVPAPIG